MRARASRWSRPIRIALAVGLAVASSWPVAAQRGAGSNAALVRSLAAKAAKGDYEGAGVYDQLRRAGMSDLEASKASEHIADAYSKFFEAQAAERQKAADEQAKKDEDQRKKSEQDAKDRDAKEQNASGDFEWHFGAVFRDRDYPVVLPIANNCRVPRTIAITYPKGIQLAGPATVMVPAQSSVDVKMTLTMTKPPMPPGPYPPGFSPACYDLADIVRLKHEEFVRETATSIYKCNALSRNIFIGMHVHQHGPPDSGGSGGGGGGDKKDKSCDVFWNTGEFFATPEKPTAEDCRDDIRQRATEFFGPMMTSLRNADPAAWLWAPSRAEIGVMSVQALMKDKARADAAVAAKFFEP